MQLNFCQEAFDLVLSDITELSKYTVAGILRLTLVEVGECFIMQFDGWRGSCTQNILKGKDLVFAVWRQVGLLLLEDGEGQYIAGEQRQKQCCQ